MTAGSTMSASSRNLGGNICGGKVRWERRNQTAAPKPARGEQAPHLAFERMALSPRAGHHAEPGQVWQAVAWGLLQALIVP